MRKLFIGCLVLMGLTMKAQTNVLLTEAYWKQKPSVAQVQQAIAEGNSPTAFNARMFDATSMAILNAAPYETVTYLIDLEGNGVNKITHDKRTYLHWAAFQNNQPVVKYLISKGADINRRDSRQFTPILFAAVGGQTDKELYELLLKSGANLKETNSDGANLLLILIPHLKDLKGADYFIKKGLKLTSTDTNGNNAIYYAATMGNKSIIEALIKKKIDPKNVNKKGENAFFAAARGFRRTANKRDFFEYLEQLGVKPNQVNSDGITPLYIVAGKNRDTEVLSYLLEKGNDPAQANNEGRTPLMNAAALNTPEIAALLLDATNNINARSKEGYTALQLAFENNSLPMVDLLISRGADIQMVDNEGNTLYHTAVKRGKLEFLEKLSAYPLDINKKNNEGLSPLQKAVMTANNVEMINFLLSKGADKNALTDLGETVYELAKENEALKGINIEFLK